MIFIGAAYNRSGVHHVSRTCFYPVPGVDSLLLHLKLKSNPVLLGRQTRELVRKLFTQRRKQIGSLISSIDELQRWLEMLPQFECSRASRPESIPVEAWLALDDLLSGIAE